MARYDCVKSDWVNTIYEPGDVVRLVSGNSPQRVMRIVDRGGVQYLVCEYLSTLGYGENYGYQRPRIASDYVLLRDVNGSGEPGVIYVNKEKEPVTKLYQTKTDPVQYGTFLTKNSAGDLVLEMKGSPGDVKAFKESDVELVVPYTISVRQLSSGTPTRPVGQFQVPKGSVEKGDLFLKGGVMYVVKELDTKAHDAPVLKGARLIQTKALGDASDTEDYPASDED